ncbi:MAG: HNH endonuclease family protein, partial [Selenomonadaceae bacterium]
DEETDNEIYKHTKIMENLSINERYPNELSIILGAVDYKEAADKVTQIKYRQKDNRYTNFFRNFKFFCEKIDELSESELNNFAKAVTQECEVIEIRSWQVEQAIMMFNSLNSDGMPLCDSDIISAKLYASADRKGEIAEFNALWKQLAENVEKLMETNVATLDGILMQQMYYVRAVNRETISDNGYVILTTPGLRRYYTEINKKLLDNPNDLCREMIHLTEAWAKVADYPLIRLLLKFNYNSKLFMASYFHRLALEKITEDNIAVVAESMLRLFTVLELVDTGFSSAKFKMFLFKENVQIADKSVSVGEIKKDFDEHIAANWTREAIRDAVMSYDGYTLVYLNEYLFAKERGMEFKMGSKCDIEHIVPSSGNNLDAIREDAGFADKDEFKGSVNKIGNKILLEERINRAIGNEWFRVKVSTKLCDRTGYIDSNYPIARYLVEKYRSKAKPFWKKKDIQAATKEASERIVRFIFGK